ncbi:TIGR03808 family TAT-translocated repetitive protein [Thermopetrobacter sp. TC1]|uniref:TIGR03808 family TAT-translocated repetitive protein n=1 Tax=Thermopetrobacter sp. TC1 TaxID=1495045 RepID=UPI00068B98D8|nr:TIGR03808 family TAT-translocated repetitive protein [Thermopetrobacter sp. TC1]
MKGISRHTSDEDKSAFARQRRRFLHGLAGLAGLGVGVLSGSPEPVLARGRRRDDAGTGPLFIEAESFGVRADGGRRDQTAVLLRALKAAAYRKAVLLLPSGTIRIGNLELSAPVRMAGRPGARLLATKSADFLMHVRKGPVLLQDIELDGQHAGKDPLLWLERVPDLRIEHCRIRRAGADGIKLDSCSGTIRECRIEAAGKAGLFSIDGRDLRIMGNNVRNCGDNGILVWQSKKREDGSLISGNVIENIRADSGGDGPYGNGINVFRAAGVRVVDNRIRRCAFSAVRNNSSDDCVIARNVISDMKEVAIFVEFAFRGAVVSDNIIENASAGISVTNLDEGGHFAVVKGNVVRNMRPRISSRDGLGYGIAVEADTSVTGNAIEVVSGIGIALGWGPYMRNVVASANVIRRCGVGIGVSAVRDAGNAVITSNVIAGARAGAIIGYDHDKPITGDLSRSGARVPGNITLANNRVS